MSARYPLLVVDKEHITLLIGKAIYCSIDRANFDEAIVAYIASYYLLDIDYPKGAEISLTIIQWILFEHLMAPKDILNEANKLYQQFIAYKN